MSIWSIVYIASILLMVALAVYLFRVAMLQERRRRSARYAAVLVAADPAECLAAFRRVLAEMVEGESRIGETPELPQSDRECYALFHQHYLPAKEQAFDSAFSLFSSWGAEEMRMLNLIDGRVARVLQGESPPPVDLPLLGAVEVKEPGWLERLGSREVSLQTGLIVTLLIMAAVAALIWYWFLALR